MHTPHLHADSLNTSCPSGTGTCLSAGPKPPKHMGSGCSKCVQQRWYFCKTGTRFSHRRGSATFGMSFSNSCGMNCTLIYVSDSFLVLLGAMAKIYMNSFSHLCGRSNLQNCFLYLVILVIIFDYSKNH